MSVKPIRPDVKLTSLKQQYLDYVAQQYDAFVEYAGDEPEAISFGFCDLDGNTGVHWLMPNEPEGSNRCAMFLGNITIEMMRSFVR